MRICFLVIAAISFFSLVASICKAFQGVTETEGALRLFGGATDSGKLEIYHEGKWGTICAPEELSRNVSLVACRQLGFGLATGEMYMPPESKDVHVGTIWLSSLQCTGREDSLSDCQHLGWGQLAAECSHAFDLGIRCLACKDESCAPKVVRFGGELHNANDVRNAFEGFAVEAPHVWRLSCYRCTDSSNDAQCAASAMFGTPSVHCATASFKSNAGSEGGAALTTSTHEGVFEDIPDPFTETMARAFVFGTSLADQYAAKRSAMLSHLASHPADEAHLRQLVKAGCLRWNAAGIIGTAWKNCTEEKGYNDAQLSLIRRLFLSQTVQLLSELDSRVGGNEAALQLKDPLASHLAKNLLEAGFASIDDFGLDISALNRTIEDAFARLDPSETSVANHGASVASRVELPELLPLIRNASINAAVKAYLGPDAELEGYKVVRLAPSMTEGQNIAALWHNDRAGRRLKLFVRLHDVDPRPEAGGHPTLVARGSHNLQYYSFEAFENSRYTEEFVQSEYTIAKLGGRMGSGFIFDTNAIHKAVPEGRLPRTVIVLEYHCATKCPVIQAMNLPLPCPSGDQHMLTSAERDLHTEALVKTQVS